MARTGRPRTNINKEQFEKLCGLQCTLKEVASFFNCSEDTIENFCKREYKETFSEVYNKYASIGKISLRRTQFKLAEKSSAMAIWLGKQILNQEEKIAIQTIDQATINDIEAQVILYDETTGDKSTSE